MRTNLRVALPVLFAGSFIHLAVAQTPVPAPDSAGGAPALPAAPAAAPANTPANTSAAASAPASTATPVGGATSSPAAPAPATPAPATPAPAAALVQPIFVPAGTGSLVQLPQPASTILAADPRIARVQPASPTTLFVIGVAPGKTTIMATSASGTLVRQFDVTVTRGQTPPPPTPDGILNTVVANGGAPAPRQMHAADAGRTEAAIHQILPGSQRVHVTALDTKLDITGMVATAELAERVIAVARGFAGDANVINDLEILSSVQVNLRVRVAEIDRTITRELGINWQVLGNPGSFQFGLFTGGAVASAISALAPSGSPGGSFPAPFSVGAGIHTARWDVNSIIDALAQDELITILAEPNLTALSGETASFLAGGEFPVPVAAANGSNGTTISVAFKQYGVSLAFVPTVLDSDHINLKVRPEVSSLTSQGSVNVPTGGGTLTIPALTVRRAETTVELGSGQSFAISGLLEHGSNQAIQSLPGIGELPILGALFRSTQFQRNETELVIIITPYLVKAAASPAQLAAPTDGFHPATDLDRVLFGRTLGASPDGRRVNAGFIVE